MSEESFCSRSLRCTVTSITDPSGAISCDRRMNSIPLILDSAGVSHDQATFRFGMASSAANGRLRVWMGRRAIRPKALPADRSGWDFSSSPITRVLADGERIGPARGSAL